jgi:hypothetical protein
MAASCRCESIVDRKLCTSGDETDWYENDLSELIVEIVLLGSVESTPHPLTTTGKRHRVDVEDASGSRNGDCRQASEGGSKAEESHGEDCEDRKRSLKTCSFTKASGSAGRLSLFGFHPALPALTCQRQRRRGTKLF